MSNMSELITKLAKCNQAKFAVEQESRKTLRDAANEVTMVSASLMELTRVHEQEIRVLKARYEKSLREYTYACRQKVHDANKQRMEMEALAEAAEERQARAEAHASHLEAKLQAMREQLKMKEEVAQNTISGIERVTTAREKRVDVQSDERERNMEHHAREVRAATGLAVETTTAELQDQLRRCHLRAEGRMRFKELCQLASESSSYKMSREAYYATKHDLISLWHIQKTRGLHGLSTARPLPSPAPAADDVPMHGALDLKASLGSQSTRPHTAASTNLMLSQEVPSMQVGSLAGTRGLTSLSVSGKMSLASPRPSGHRVSALRLME